VRQTTIRAGLSVTIERLNEYDASKECRIENAELQFKFGILNSAFSIYLGRLSNFGLDTRKTKVYKFLRRTVPQFGVKVMTTTVKIEKIGDKFVLPLSEQMLDKLGVSNGGEIEATDFEDRIELRGAQKGDERKREFRKLADEMFEDYKELFTALAEGAK
jgi:hypothetical protein